MNPFRLTDRDLVNYAILTGKDYEYYTPKFDRFGYDLNESTQLGIEIQKDVYYWFTIHTDRNGKLEFVLSGHRYNRNTGTSIKSYDKYYKTLKKIANELEKLNYFNLI